MSGHHTLASTKVHTTRLASSGRNMPAKAQNMQNLQNVLAAAKKNKPATRVENARMLRAKFTELQDSPDGADLDPLTIPKCVECAHCGWPVYPRECKVATKKTFARAGIDRGSKKEEEAKRRAAIQKALDAGEEIPPELLKQEGGGPAASEADSRDTVERMADQLQELEDKNQELEKRLEDMENQSKSLVDERDKLQEDLDDATDKIEYMEEAEERWRDKVAKARIENDRILQDLERASFVSSDREGGLIASLLDARQLREVIAVMKRRRAFMLANMQEELRKRQEDDERKTVLNSWKIRIMKDAFQKELDDLDVRRRKEVRELQEQLLTDRTHITALQVHVEQLRGKLRQAAHRMVERSMSSKVWPFAQSHALRAWCGIHPSVVLENELERTRKKLQETEDALDEANQRVEALKVELEQTTTERDALLQRIEAVLAEMEYIKEEAGLDEDSIARKKAAVKAHEDEWNRRLKEVQDKLDELQELYDTETETLAKQLKATQSKLAITQDALNATSMRPGSGADPDAFRVVPNGQGILCCGCLKQIVLRDVTPLPPKGAMTASAPDLEEARRAFFKKGLGGRLQQDDKFQNMLWNDAKDPYRLSKLVAEPEFQVIRDPSPKAADATPRAGLPALKTKGLASLKSSSRDFRPRVFR
ncbi:unnamed protein product [Effrenium voratum]|uniref:Uncharacterized protein n=2 Tax=Effrenium voratum TaxID=2562239 RepID=A0AA36HNM6_9DINO|nr:unnamed protein product [Effrenium voratum]CAJ1444710.1 unnamed protein product [Effrenium voratum]